MRVNYRAPQKVKDHKNTKQDMLLQDLATKSPAEISQFIDNTFGNLNAVQRKFLKVLGMVAVQYIRDRLQD